MISTLYFIFLGNKWSKYFTFSRISLQGIMSQLYDVMYDFNFSLPPDYALVIRALGSLEGTAKALDPDFKVIESAYPFVIGRLLADPNPDMRKILRELLIHNDGSIRWNRLERLVCVDCLDCFHANIVSCNTISYYKSKNSHMILFAAFRIIVLDYLDLFNLSILQIWYICIII